MHRFAATLDSQTKKISFVVIVIVLIPILTSISAYSHEHNPWIMLAPAIVILALGIAALYYVRGYGLDRAGLHILRPVGEVVYPLHQIRSITSVNDKEMGFGIRTFGSGGFLGYFGKFYYRKIGHITFYVTDREKMLLITLEDDKKIIISPDDTAAFMAAFQELMKKY